MRFNFLCEILKSELGLEDRRVYLWDQKINAPTDSGMFIAVSVRTPKVFGMLNIEYVQTDEGMNSVQSVNMAAIVNLDVISRDNSALNRKEEVVMALKSMYAENQQKTNSFFIGSIPSQFTDLSQIDGTAIPYRFTIAIALQYFVSKTKAVPYYDTFQDFSVTTDP